jgi:hypothetical protein
MAFQSSISNRQSTIAAGVPPESLTERGECRMTSYEHQVMSGRETYRVLFAGLRWPETLHPPMRPNAELNLRQAGSWKEEERNLAKSEIF